MATHKVTVRGVDVTFTSAYTDEQAIQKLRQNVTSTFARSLLDGYCAGGGLTECQMSWVHKLVHDYEQIYYYPKIVAVFAMARACNASKLTFGHLELSRVDRRIVIKSNGRVPSGLMRGTKMPSIMIMLERFNADPSSYAAAYATISGMCCVCCVTGVTGCCNLCKLAFRF